VIVVLILGVIFLPGFTLGVYLMNTGHELVGLFALFMALVRVSNHDAAVKVQEKVKIVERVVFKGAKMTRDEAYSALGLTPGAGREAVQTAYRKMMQRVHPDTGGSDYLAARVNEARKILLG